MSLRACRCHRRRRVCEPPQEIVYIAYDFLVRTPLAPLPTNVASSFEEPSAATKAPKSCHHYSIQDLPTTECNSTAPKAATRRKSPKPPEAPAAPPTPLPSLVDEAILKYLQPLLNLNYVERQVSDFQAFANLVGLDWEKIGDGSYGDVFRLTVGSNVRIIKCIPLRPQRGTGSKSKFTPVKEAADEIAIATRMQPIEGFVDFCTAQVVYGPYPRQCVEAWSRFKERGEECGTPDPNQPDSYIPDQLWVLMQMKDAGMALDRYCDLAARKVSGLPTTLNMWQTFDLFWDVVKAVIRGEEIAQFEHRDLHLGNICIQHLDEITAYGPEKINLLQYGGSKELGWTSIKITIIDYTLSRVNMDDGSVRYNPMKDPSLFNQFREGQDIQYKVYPLMKEIVLGPARRKDETRWSKYHPKTNVLWLWHLLEKVLAATEPIPAFEEDSAPVDAPSEHVTLARMREKSNSLHSLCERLEPGQKISGPPIESASHLLSYALDNGWLSPEDVVDGSEDDGILESNDGEVSV